MCCHCDRPVRLRLWKDDAHGGDAHGGRGRGGIPPSATKCINRWNTGSSNYTGPDPAKYKSVVIGYTTPRTGGGVRRCAIVLRDSKGNFTWLVYRDSRYQRVAVQLTMDCRYEPDQIVTIDPTGQMRRTGNTACP